jgi:hypothetical protein
MLHLEYRVLCMTGVVWQVVQGKRKRRRRSGRTNARRGGWEKGIRGFCGFIRHSICLCCFWFLIGCPRGSWHGMAKDWTGGGEKGVADDGKARAVPKRGAVSGRRGGDGSH